jgi:hypothetical protein
VLPRLPNAIHATDTIRCCECWRRLSFTICHIAIILLDAKENAPKKMERLNWRRKSKTRREWTATDIHKLKGRAKKKVGEGKVKNFRPTAVGAEPEADINPDDIPF